MERALTSTPSLPDVSSLTESQRRLLTARLHQAAPAVTSGPATIPRRDPCDPPMMSAAQRGLALIDELSGGTNAYNVVQALRLRGRLDLDALRRSLDMLVRRHQVLRSRFSPDGSLEVLAPGPAQLSIETVDEQEVTRFVADRASEPFDLAAGGTLRAHVGVVGPDDHVLVLVVHHIASDAASKQILNEELTALYAAFRAGRPDPLDEPALQYSDWVAWARDHGHEASDLAWWTERLAGAPDQVELPFDRPPHREGRATGGLVVVPLAADVVERLDAFCSERGVTPYMVLLTAYAALVERYAAQGSVVVGSPVSGRHDPALERVVGLFLNTLPVRVDTSGSPGFASLLERCREASVDVLRHQRVPFESIVNELRPARVPGRNPVFQTTLTWKSGRTAVPQLDGLEVSAIPFAGRWAKFDLALICFRAGGQVRIGWEYSCALFSEGMVRRLANQLELLLDAGMREPERPIDTLVLTTERDLDDLARWNDTRAVVPDELVHHRVRRWAREVPDAPAVGDADGWLTYRQLEERANQLAHALIELGVGPDERVAICLDRSTALSVALWAVLKAGGAYVPLDPDYPSDRLAYMLTSSGARVLITHSSLQHDLPPHPSTLLVDLLDVSDRPTHDPEVPVGGHHLAYVIYTSGTTGRPKGVAQTHRGVVNQMWWMQERYHLTPDDVVLQKTPYSFDVSTWELLLTPYAGARLFMCAPGRHGDPWYLQRVVEEEGVSVLHFVPSMLRAFVSADVLAPRTTLRLVVACGEALPDDVKDACLEAWPGVVLDNVYGPTETIGVTADQTAPDRPVTLGRPGANCTAHVLDADHQPLPPGMAGELWLGGTQVARGYLGRDDLTAERFVSTSLGRLYRTGDRCVWQRDGLLQFRGRVDDQVKLRGHRVEPGEIENLLSSHDGVQAVCCVVAASASGEQVLVAYVVPAADDAVPHDTLAESVTELARTRLPPYMVPQVVQVETHLPLSAAGKLDRGALRARGVTVHQDAHVEPSTDTERRLELIWRRELRLSEPISVTQSFFDIGGSSLVALRVFPAIERELAVKLRLAVLFENVTIRTLAAVIDAEIASTSPWETLVTVQPRGDRLPLWAFPALRGSAVIYRHMSQYFAPDRPVHVVEAVGLDGRRAARTTLGGVADDAFETVRRIQPHGPYYLTGFCFGGVVAYEVGTRLEAAGEEVAFVGVIEAAPYGRDARGRARRLGLRQWNVWLARLPLLLTAQRNRAVVTVTALLGWPGPARFVDLMSASQVAQRRHRTSRSGLRVDLFLPRTEDQRRGHGMDRRWAAVAAGGCEVHVLEADSFRHVEMVKGNQAEQVARLINDRLAGLD